ncbi:hypothetical protein B0H67DRAFT_496362 [Lasiosphaeris hirsuta]|uniref:Uncharacterized protein n=1 Tax=Lasiosphaeris hirsuta TaxID=260670 RepID=A0AA40A109_9PEZI|nr:hypothetical protein B0H67DRAFT_496362 [Lasiosphaeris hirsuta]
MNDGDTTLLAYCASLFSSHEDQNLPLTRPVTAVICPTLTPLTGGHAQQREVQQYWVTVSYGHAGFFHAVLCLSALQLAIAQPESSTTYLERFMHHRLGSIGAIQADLATPARALSNENIATVFHLLCIEENLMLHAPGALSAHAMWAHLQPDSGQRAAHLAGLKRMLALRGGLAALGDMRGLQSFMIRWVCTSLGCRLVFALPRFYRPSEPAGADDDDDDDDDELCEGAFAASSLLPQGLLRALYAYPEASRFYAAGSAMARRCEAVGMDAELVRFVLVIECLLEDTAEWVARRDEYAWDALDMQNLFALALGELVRWNLERERELSAAENVTAMCLFIFVFFIGNGAHAACSPLPGVLPRMRAHFRDPDLAETLQAVGMETWVAFLMLIVSNQDPEDGDFFFRFFVEMLAQRSPPVTTFEHLRATLATCVWTPLMEAHLRKVWDETGEEWKRLRAEMAGDGSVLQRAKRPPPTDDDVKPSIPFSNPYVTSQMKRIFLARESARGKGLVSRAMAVATMPRNGDEVTVFDASYVRCSPH